MSQQDLVCADSPLCKRVNDGGRKVEGAVRSFEENTELNKATDYMSQRGLVMWIGIDFAC